MPRIRFIRLSCSCMAIDGETAFPRSSTGSRVRQTG